MKQRIEYIDTAKGILILFVVLGHVFETGPVNQFVYSFHMPAFFIISGIMQHYSSALKKPLRQALLEKIYSLIIPFLFFEVLGVLSNIIRFGVTLNVFGYAYNTLTLCCNNGPNWFLWALFVAEVMFLLIHKYFSNRYVIWSISAVIGLFMVVNRDFYSTFGSTGVGFMFLTFGYYAAPLFTKPGNKAALGVALLFSVVSCIYNGKVDLGPWVFGNVPLYLIGSVTGTFWVIEISKLIRSKLLVHFGRNTLTVLGTHQAINLALRARIGIAEYTTPQAWIVFIGITALQLPVIRIFNKYIPFLIGKKGSMWGKSRKQEN
jgi:fucose 4-O-acetylase-like acetyltransferase